MKLEQSFSVDAPLDRVWAMLTDVERVAPCLPGASLTGTGDDGTFRGAFKVKLGPTTAEYTGTLVMEERDEASHRAVLRADGRDKRGQGGAKATIVSTMSETAGGGTEVHVDTDFSITGRLARFGRSGMIEDVSSKLLREFGRCLEETLGDGETPPASSGNGKPEPPKATPRPASEPLDAGNVVGAVLLDRVKEAAPIALLTFVLGWLLGRRGG